MLQKLYNPVLMKELKLRFRFFKSITGLMFYLLALCIVVSGFFMIVTQFSGRGYFRPSESFILFMMISVLQMGLVMFITPGLTAGAISTEREKQTLNMLLMTTQSSWQIIIGKLTSSIAFLGLLLIAGLPIYSIVFLFGGVSPLQLVTIFFFYFVTMVAIGSIGSFFSTVTKENNYVNDCDLRCDDFFRWLYCVFLFHWSCYRSNIDGRNGLILYAVLTNYVFLGKY